MSSPESVSDDAALAALLENHRAFLRYLERRVGDRELAEDILQDAFIARRAAGNEVVAVSSGGSVA